MSPSVVVKVLFRKLAFTVPPAVPSK